MEDVTLVQIKINELNRTSVQGTWTAVNGYFAMTGFSFNNGSPQFNPSFGYPLKLFVNTQTKEVKSFSAHIFER